MIRTDAFCAMVYCRLFFVLCKSDRGLASLKTRAFKLKTQTDKLVSILCMLNKKELVALRPFTVTITTLKERLEEFGFQVNEVISEKDLLTYQGQPPLAILPLPTTPPSEALLQWVQRVKNNWPDTEIYGVFAGRLKYPMARLFPMGFRQVFQAPFEEELMLNKIFEKIPVEYEVTDITFDHLMRAGIFEFEVQKSCPFDVYIYLPFNKKVVLYIKQGQPVDEKTIEKFRSNQNYNTYIKRSDIKKYLEFTQNLLVGSIQATEEGKPELKNKFSQLMKGFFSEDFIEDEGRDLLDSFKSLTTGLTEKISANPKDLSAVEKLAAQKMTHQSHAENVSAYCCLFGSIVGIKDIEALRLGGLLHDIGLADLPAEMLGQDFSKMEEGDQAKYKLHPGNGKITAGDKIKSIPPAVLEMILLHHERMDGSGYPYGHKAEKLSDMVKICAFADEFDKLTSVRKGYQQLTPKQAMRRLAGLDGEASLPVYDKTFHKPIVDAFLGDEKTSSAQKEAKEGLVREATTEFVPASSIQEEIDEAPPKGALAAALDAAKSSSSGRSEVEKEQGAANSEIKKPGTPEQAQAAGTLAKQDDAATNTASSVSATDEENKKTGTIASQAPAANMGGVNTATEGAQNAGGINAGGADSQKAGGVNTAQDEAKKMGGVAALDDEKKSGSVLTAEELKQRGSIIKTVDDKVSVGKVKTESTTEAARSNYPSLALMLERSFIKKPGERDWTGVDPKTTAALIEVETDLRNYFESKNSPA